MVYLKNEINNLKRNNNNKNTRDLYPETYMKFKMKCQPRTKLVKMRTVMYLQIP
jgi:hypothetical protein